MGTGLAEPDRINAGLVIVCGFGGSLLGAMVGVGVGMNLVRRIRGVLLAVPAGMVLGAAVGVMVAMPNCLPAAAIGAAILVAFAGVVRFFSDDPSPQ